MHDSRPDHDFLNKITTSETKWSNVMKNIIVNEKDNIPHDQTGPFPPNTLREHNVISAEDREELEPFNSPVVMNAGLEVKRSLKVRGFYNQGNCIYTLTDYASFGPEIEDINHSYATNSVGVAIPHNSTISGYAMIRLRLFGLTTSIAEYVMSVDIIDGQLQGELISVAPV